MVSILSMWGVAEAVGCLCRASCGTSQKCSFDSKTEAKDRSQLRLFECFYTALLVSAAPERCM